MVCTLEKFYYLEGKKIEKEISPLLREEVKVEKNGRESGDSFLPRTWSVVLVGLSNGWLVIFTLNGWTWSAITVIAF